MVKNGRPGKSRSYRGTHPKIPELWRRARKIGELSRGQSYCFDVALLLRCHRLCPRKKQSYCVTALEHWMPQYFAELSRGAAQSYRGSPPKIPELSRNAPRIPRVIAGRLQNSRSYRGTLPEFLELSRNAPENAGVVAGRPPNPGSCRGAPPEILKLSRVVPRNSRVCMAWPHYCVNTLKSESCYTTSWMC